MKHKKNRMVNTAPMMKSFIIASSMKLHERILDSITLYVRFKCYKRNVMCQFLDVKFLDSIVISAAR